MLYLDDPGLNLETAQGLRGYQAEVGSAGTYAEQVETDKNLFSRYNRPRNPVFRVVREELAAMCSGVRRCGYCEDSAGDEIEHLIQNGKREGPSMVVYHGTVGWRRPS